MNTKYTVYTISLGSEVKYIGVTSDFERRKKQHLNCAGTRSSVLPKGVNFQNIILNVVFDTFDKKKAFEIEDKLIIEYDTMINGWNRQRSGLIKTGREREYDKERYLAHRQEKIESVQRRRKENREAYNRYMREYRKRKKAEKNSQPN